MKIFEAEDGKGETCLILTRDEGRELCNLLTEVTESKGLKKPIRKNSKAWKLFNKISQELPVW